MTGLEQAVDLGFDRILTSDGAQSVEQGVNVLSNLHVKAAGRIDILAGFGLTPSLILPINKETGVTASHSSCSRPSPQQPKLISLGFSSDNVRKTDVEWVKQFLSEVERITQL